MLAPFPETGKLDVSSALAGELLSAIERLPLFDNKEFYSTALQVMVLNHIRESCTDGFDELVSTISERIARWPYCALVRGLRFDEGNRLFVAINRSTAQQITAINGVTLSGTAKVYQMTAASAQGQNPIHPVLVQTTPVSGTSMTFTLPALSVSTIEVK